MSELVNRAPIHSGHWDMDGIPIYVGDLIRVKHFIHRSARRMMFMYFRVAVKDGVCVVQNWNDLDASKHQCLLKDCGLSGLEVIAHDGLEYNSKGEIITFNERPRLKKIVCDITKKQQ